MKTKLLIVLLLLMVFDAPAAIIFFTDKPNSPPVGSDFFALQRNRDYINSSFNQVSNVLFLNPVFTGIMYGNGLGITNINATGTNANFTFITNFTLFSTNITVQNLTTTNVTINFPGGFTNLNLTANSVMKTDNNDAESSVPNAVGVLTNNGIGGIGFNNKLSLQEIDALNFYPTNLFTGLTNFAVLATDGNGLLTLGQTTTNLTVTNLFVTTVYASTNFSTNLYFVSGKGNTLIITNYISIQAGGGGLTNKTLTPLSAMASDANDAEISIANAHGVLTNSAGGPPVFGLLQNTELVNSSITVQGSAVALGGSTLAAGSSPSFNLVNSTNLIYRYTTNAVPALTLTFGNSYFTNVSTANITISAINVQDLAAYESCVLWCTNSSGTSWTVTLPNGIGSPGLGLPPVITVTNKQSCQIYIEHYGNQATNAWFKAIY